MQPSLLHTSKTPRSDTCSALAYVSIPSVSIRQRMQHTYASPALRHLLRASIRQQTQLPHTSAHAAYVSIRVLHLRCAARHTLHDAVLCACIRQHTSAHVSIRETDDDAALLACDAIDDSALVSIRQHMSAYVSIRLACDAIDDSALGGLQILLVDIPVSLRRCVSRGTAPTHQRQPHSRA